MRRGVRAITGAFGEEVTAEDLRHHSADRLGRFRRRMALWALGAALYGLAAGRAEVWALLVALLTAEAMRAAFAHRLLHRPIASADLPRLRAASLALAVVTSALWCLVIASLWSEEPSGARFLAMILAIAAIFEAAFQYSPNRLPNLVELVLHWSTLVVLFLRQGARDGWASGLEIEAAAMGVLAYLSLMYLFDIGAMRHRLGQAGSALATRGAALERALAELTEKEQAMRRLALAAEHVNDSIVITDPEGRVEWVNGAFTARTGWTLDEIAGRPRRSLSDPDNDPAVFAAIDAALAERRPLQMQIRLWGRGGRSVWHEASLTPLFDAEGRLTNYISVERDISERKAREAELARSQAEAARLALVAEHARDSVVIYSPEGRIEWVNLGFTAQTGYAPEEALGRMAGGMVAPGADEVTLIRVRAAMVAERAIRAELQLRRKDGGVFWCEADLSPVHGPDGRLRHYVSVERDISDLKAREAELARAERENRRLALVARHSGDCIVLTDDEGLIEWVNAAFEAQSGLRLEDVRGWAIKRLVAPGCDQVGLAALQAAAREERPHRTQLQLIRHGRPVWHDVSMTFIHDEDGRLRHLISVERDISELKAREAELAEKERELRRLALVAQHATDCIALANPEGRVEWVNASFRAGMGWALGEVEGRHLKSFIAPECDPAILAELREATQGGLTYRAQVPVSRRDGSAWHDVIATPIRDEGGAIVHWIAVLRDITELKAREAELAEKDAQNRRLALVARHSGDAILLTDPAGVIEWVNAAFSSATGLDTGEVAGRHISAFDAPDGDLEALEALRVATRAQQPCRTELRVLRRGRSVWHDVSQTPILGEDGALAHWISVERDISELKAREAELAQARRAAEEAAETRARFLATMSHEIRTPMNGIIGTADLLAETPLGEDQRRLLGTISLSSEALLRIINDILDLSKLEAGAVEIAPEPFEPAALAEVCAQLMRPLAARKGLALALELEGAAREPLMGDPGRLRQVLLNLLGNAIKFTEEGRVTLRAAVAPEGARRRLVLAVSDTGIGIAPERLEGVFDAFAQADGTITRRFGGTGLGLSISRQLAQAMGGELTAASAPGEGSTFTLALDLSPAAEAAPAIASVEGEGGALGPHDPPARAEPSGGAATLAVVPAAPEPEGAALVLLVEDNATNRFLVQRMLGDVGLRIATAEDGAEGVEAFERLAPDLVITDVSMPVMDGFEATRRIRAIETGPGWPRPPCPVLALSANVGAGDRERGAQAGITRFLAKPIRKAELRAAVLAALSRGGEGAAAPAPPLAPPGANGPAAAAGLG